MYHAWGTQTAYEISTKEKKTLNARSLFGDLRVEGSMILKW